jgi:hypothetical protein
MENLDAEILNSVWSAFVKLAAQFPEDQRVVMTLQYHDWYSRQCNFLAQRPESATTQRNVSLSPGGNRVNEYHDEPAQPADNQ